jgi:cobaltochelatase CobS
MSLEKEIAAALQAQIKGVPAHATPKMPAKAPSKPVAALSAMGEGEVAFSSVFGYMPSFGDFGVRVLPVNGNPDIAALVPKADPAYLPQKGIIEQLVLGFMCGDRTMLSGPTGSGKSSAIEYIGAMLRWPFIRVNMSADIESGALFGSLTAEGGATKWNDGPVAEAVKAGAILLIDEWELMPSEIGMGMQRILEDGGSLVIKEKPGTMADRTYIPHENFRIVYAGNTTGCGDATGHYIGTRPQNKATIGRFNNNVRLGYLDKAHEVGILTKRGTPELLAASMVEVASLVRNAFDQGAVSLTMSPRTLIAWAAKHAKMGDLKLSFALSYCNALSDDEQVGVWELFDKVN